MCSEIHQHHIYIYFVFQQINLLNEDMHKDTTGKLIVFFLLVKLIVSWRGKRNKKGFCMENPWPLLLQQEKIPLYSKRGPAAREPYDCSCCQRAVRLLFGSVNKPLQEVLECGIVDFVFVLILWCFLNK